MLNPVPDLSTDTERFLTEEQRSFLETTADPRFTYLVWHGAMKVAKAAGTHADYVDPEVLLPRALFQIESSNHSEKLGDFAAARKLRQEAAVDMSLAMKTMGDLLGIQNQERFWRTCIVNGKSLWNGRADPVSRRSLALLGSIEELFRGEGQRFLSMRRENLDLKLSKIAAVHAKIEELKTHKSDESDFKSVLKNVSAMLQDAEQVAI